MPVKGKKTRRDSFSQMGELKVLQKLNEYEYGVELWMMDDADTGNRTRYQSLVTDWPSFVGQPILIAYVGGKVGDGHNFREKRDRKTGEMYYSYTDATSERIVGTLSDDKNDFSLRQRDGHTWLVAKGKLFAFYAKELVDNIVLTGSMNVSVETLVHESHEEDGIEVITSFSGIGVTILGKGVAPAIPGASIATLAKLKTEFNELKFRAASLEQNPDKQSNTQNSNKGGDTTLIKFCSKRRCKELSAKFNGYEVFAAAESDGKIVAYMRNSEGNFFGYRMESENDTPVPEKFIELEVNAVFGTGDEAYSRDLVEFMESETRDMKAELNSVKEKLDTATKELEAANLRIQEMETFESNRRVNAAEEMAKATLAKFNANRTDKVGEDAVAAIMADIKNNHYTNSVSEDKKDWLGAKQVERDVLAVCGQAVMDMESKKAAEQKKSFGWAGDFSDPNTNGGGSLLDLLR